MRVYQGKVSEWARAFRQEFKAQTGHLPYEAPVAYFQWLENVTEAWHVADRVAEIENRLALPTDADGDEQLASLN